MTDTDDISPQDNSISILGFPEGTGTVLGSTTKHSRNT